MTNWYNNHFVFTSQFVSNAGYRKNIIRNYEVVNLGSNPARFAFFYEKVLGQNWSTGTQGLDMDLEILKYFHSYIKKNGYVLIPIVPFSSISSYLKLEDAPLNYLAKFVSILDPYQVRRFLKIRKISLWMRYPLLYNLRAFRYLIFDEEKDRRLETTEQPMETIDLMMDAEYWMKTWKDEFNIKNLEFPLSEELQECRKQSIGDLQSIIDFCKKRQLKPVLIIPPMSEFLSCKFSANMREIYVYSFVKQLNLEDAIFLDYWNDKRFSASSLYFNSFFLNLKGRKKFTQIVLTDIGIITN